MWDGHPAPPPAPRLSDSDELGGRGLFLVQELSDCWGFYYPALPDNHEVRNFDRFRFTAVPVPPELRPVTGKVVWCEFRREPGVPVAS